MATLTVPISIREVIFEIRCMIECEFCDEMARGLASAEDGKVLPSCGKEGCGTDFQPGKDNPFFITRDNLLQVAQRCSDAEERLAKIIPLAERCKEIKDNLDTYGSSSAYALTTDYRDACEELWETVID